MKKIACLLISFFLAGGGSIFAQEMMDAYKYSQFDLHGTARFSSMAGAFGALGGDISSMTTNPAGIGIYRSSEVVATLNLSSVKADANLLGSKADESKTKFNFDNIAYVGYFPTGNYSGVKGWNVGFAYNRVKNFARNYTTRGTPGSSLSDYIAAITNDLAIDNINGDYSGNNLWLTDDYNPFNTRLNQLAIAGYSGGLIAAENSSKIGGFFNPFNGLQQTELTVTERGAIDQYDFVLATNISDILFLGATFVLTDLDYSYTSIHKEDFSDKSYADLHNSLTTEGNGYSFNVGAIVRPTDYLRLGLAYNSPTWYKLTDYSSVAAESNVQGDGLIDVFNNPSPTDYKLRTNDRWIFSAAGILGQYGLISVDYELNNYKNISLSDYDGFKLDGQNKQIKNGLGTSGTLRIGAEARVTPQFAIRVGGAWANTPFNSYVKDGTDEVFTAGTIPHYTVDRGTNCYTVGFGYRFTPRFYADLACVYKEYKEDVYSFSMIFDPESKKTIQPTPASMKTKTTRVALTLGYKF